MAYSHGVFPLVYNTLKIYDDLIPHEQISYMKQVYMNIVKQNMLMTSELIKVIELLENNAIKVIAFKGPSLSQLLYGDITLRQYSDLDILVDIDDLYTVSEILKSINIKADKSIDFLKNEKLLEIGSDFSLFSQNNIHLELHWNLFRKLLIDKSTDFISSNNLEVNINSKKIKTLNYDYLLIYLCVHGSKHLWERIEWIVDIDKLLKVGIFDWNFILKISKELKVYNMFLLGISLSDELFDSNIPTEIRNHYLTNNKVQNLKFKMINLLNSNFMHEEKEKKIMILKFKYIMQMFDSKVEPLKYIISIIFKPTHYDIYFINIPSAFSFLYYLVRPIRIIFNSIKK